MSPEKKQTLKLLKVDNWSVFLLQRLQLMFAKGDCCDLTLKFCDQQELKVHKLVLTTCTKYFETAMEVNKTIRMPDSLTYTSMLPIINFMYSGKLEFKPELQESLLRAAKLLNMAILVQLLIAEKSPSQAAKIKKIICKEGMKSEPTFKSPSFDNESSSQWSSPLSMLSEKKLPFWRKRVFPMVQPVERPEPEDPRPTRFELPSEETSSLMLNVPSFNEISYESEPVVPSPVDFTLPKERNEGPIKRRVAPPMSSGKAQKLTESQIISGNWSDEDDDGHFECIHSFDDSDDEQPSDRVVTSTTPKPILKPSVEQPPASSSKKVRFCLAKEDKENEEKINSNQLDAFTDTSKAIINTDSQLILPDLQQRTVKLKEEPKDDNATVPNHAKIIAEVLKKFPDLVKNNKNIKVKISTPSAGVRSLCMDPNVPVNNKQQKSSYVVVKPNPLKTEPLPVVQSLSNECENNPGRWVCKRCTVDNKYLVLDSYDLLRKHLTEVHSLALKSNLQSGKIDPKICEICGYKASKKNLHLFHLYTKHNIPPPKNVVFPKCSLCKYVALNEALLAKHSATHQVVSKELVCNICKLSFKSACIFQAHCVTCKPNSEVRNYSCNKCNKIFRTSVSLKAHFKDCRSPTGGPTQSSAPPVEQPVEMIEVPLMNNIEQNQKDHSLVQLPTGIIVTDSPNMALIHPDGNGLSNVTSAIPNIGFTVLPEDHQTVILLDENSEFFLQGNNSVVVTSENDEYVVPEILQENMTQLYSASNISYTVNGTSVITYPVVHMQQDGSLTEHPNNTLSSLPVSQTNDIFVANKEITITDDLTTDTKPNLENSKTGMLVDTAKDNTMHIASENEVTEEVINPTTCIVRIDESLALNQQNRVCLVDSNTPISIMESDGTITDTTSVSLVDNNNPIGLVPDAPVSIVGTDSTVEIIKRNETNSVELKPTVISVTAEPVKSASPPPPAKIHPISTEWDFDAEEEDSEIVDDPDSRPSRPSIDLQEIV